MVVLLGTDSFRELLKPCKSTLSYAIFGNMRSKTPNHSNHTKKQEGKPPSCIHYDPIIPICQSYQSYQSHTAKTQSAAPAAAALTSSTNG